MSEEIFKEEFIVEEKVVATLNSLGGYFEKHVDSKNPIEVFAYFELASKGIQDLQKEFMYEIFKQLFDSTGQDVDEYLRDTACKQLGDALSNIKDETLKKALRRAFE